MHPVKFEYSNGKVGEIPVNRSHGVILSRWGMTWRERLSILFHGTMWLMVKGEAMPPVLLSGDQAFKVENDTT